MSDRYLVHAVASSNEDDIFVSLVLLVGSLRPLTERYESFETNVLHSSVELRGRISGREAWPFSRLLMFLMMSWEGNAPVDNMEGEEG